MIQYIFIDDEADSGAAAFAEALSDAGPSIAGEKQLCVVALRPDTLPAVLEHIAGAKPSGILMDIALTRTIDGNAQPLAFDGIALAQQLRTLQTRQELPATPIVRLSQSAIVSKYVGGDTTSEDLFDEKLSKDDLVDNAGQQAKILVGLANGYPIVRAFVATDHDPASMATLLGLDIAFVEQLDSRILLGFQRQGAPAHVFARYLIETLLRRAGPLVPTELLAVRLGVDVESSGEDWKTLLGRLPGAYSGAFDSAYPRWWMAAVLAWWQQLPNSPGALQRITADNRVKFLQVSQRLAGLQAIQETADSPGRRYWHICSKSKRPVDPSEGYPLIPEWGHEPWQDPDYLCLEEAKRDSRNPRLRETERSRLQQKSA